jgi:hypothetical protein
MEIWRGSGQSAIISGFQLSAIFGKPSLAKAAASVLDGLIEDWSVMPCRRLQALG